VNLTKWAIEYQEFVAEALPLSMKSLLLRLYQAAKYELIEAAVGSKYGLAAKCKWDGLAIVIFWKVIDVLDDFHSYMEIVFEKTHIYCNTWHFI